MPELVGENLSFKPLHSLGFNFLIYKTKVKMLYVFIRNVKKLNLWIHAKLFVLCLANSKCSRNIGSNIVLVVWANKMVEQVNVLACKADDLPRTHMVESETWLLWVIFWPSHVLPHTYKHTDATHMYSHRQINVQKSKDPYVSSNSKSIAKPACPNLSQDASTWTSEYWR